MSKNKSLVDTIQEQDFEGKIAAQEKAFKFYEDVLGGKVTPKNALDSFKESDLMVNGKTLASILVESFDGKHPDPEGYADHQKDNNTSKQNDPGPAFSINNRVIVEPYVTDRSLKSKEVNGFAVIQQKVSLKGLKVLVQARINDGKQVSSIISKGDIVYVREELLHAQPWAQKIMESEAVEGKFIIIDIAHIEFVVPK